MHTNDENGKRTTRDNKGKVMGYEQIKGLTRMSSRLAGRLCSNSKALSQMRMSSISFTNLVFLESPSRDFMSHDNDSKLFQAN